MLCVKNLLEQSQPGSQLPHAHHMPIAAQHEYVITFISHEVLF